MSIVAVAGERGDVAQQSEALTPFIARAPESQYGAHLAQARRLLFRLSRNK